MSTKTTTCNCEACEGATCQCGCQESSSPNQAKGCACGDQCNCSPCTCGA